MSSDRGSGGGGAETDGGSGSSSSHGSSESSLLPGGLPRTSEEEERNKSKQVPGGAYRSEGSFPVDCVNEDLKRLESLSSMMASVESGQSEDRRRNHRAKEEGPPSLPPLPTSLDIAAAALATPDQVPAAGKMPKQSSRHSKSRTPVAPEPSLGRASAVQASPGTESRQHVAPHERRPHKRKSPIADNPHNARAEGPPASVPPVVNVPSGSRKDRHKSDKRASVNQEGLKVKITFNKSETKTGETNHVLPPPPLPPMPPLPTLASTGQPYLKMKINRKYLENNGKVVGGPAPPAPLLPPPPPPPPPPAQLGGREGSMGGETMQQQQQSHLGVGGGSSSESEGGRRKQEGLKLVISKDRLSQGSHNNNSRKQDRESRKRERSSPKGHDPLRNSEGFPNKVGRLDHHSGHGGSRSQMSMPPPPPFIRGGGGPPQGHHYGASNGKPHEGYVQSQQPMVMQYAQPPLYPALPPHQQYFQYQSMPPGYPSQGLPQFLTNPLPPPPPPPPLEPLPPRDRPPLPRDPPPPPPPLPPE